MTRKGDKPDQGRARQAKGSVLEAIGKIIGDPAIETRGLRESEAGARQAETERRPARQVRTKDIPARQTRTEHPIDPSIDTDGED